MLSPMRGRYCAHGRAALGEKRFLDDGARAEAAAMKAKLSVVNYGLWLCLCRSVERGNFVTGATDT